MARASRVKDLLKWGVEELRKHGIDTSRLDAEVLLAHAMRKGRLQLYLALEDAPDEKLEPYYRALMGKRSAHMPVSYLTGHREFMSLDFMVNESVLIPRPETEILVETVGKLGKARDRVLELGTGSGAIAVSLAKYNPDLHVVATDISMEALRVARKNARRHEVMDRISFLQSDLLMAFSLRETFDWVVSNPPYISEGDLAHLPAGIRNYEPMLALDGGVDGLDVIRRIIAKAHILLKSGGKLAMEVGYEQSENIQKVANNAGRYSDCSIIEDYAGIPRVLYWSRGKE